MPRQKLCLHISTGEQDKYSQYQDIITKGAFVICDTDGHWNGTVHNMLYRLEHTMRSYRNIAENILQQRIKSFCNLHAKAKQKSKRKIVMQEMSFLNDNDYPY